MNEKCVFCKIVKKEIDSKFEEESENFIAILDIKPKVKGHTLIIPKEHYETLMDIPENLLGEMIGLARSVAKKRADSGANGFNLLMNNFSSAGQVVMHAHIHVLPRYSNDKKKLGFFELDGEEFSAV